MGFRVVSGGVKSTGNLLLDREPTIPKFKVISGGEKTASIEPKFKVVSTPKSTSQFTGKPKNWVAEGLKKTVSDIGQGFADVPAQLQDLLTMPARVLGTPHPPMVSKLATQIDEPVADFNLPVLTPRNIKPLFTGKFKNIETTPVSPSMIDIGLNTAAVAGPLLGNIRNAIKYNQQLRQQLAKPVMESILRGRASAIDVPGEEVIPRTELPLPKSVEPGKALVPVEKPISSTLTPKTAVSGVPTQAEPTILPKLEIGAPIAGGQAFKGQPILKPGEITAGLKVVQTTKPADIKDVSGRKLKFGANDSIFTYPIVNQETGKFTGKVMLKDGDKGIVSLPKDLTPEQAKIEIEKRITGQKPFTVPEEGQVEEVVKGGGLKELPQFLKTPEGEATNIGSFSIDIKKIGNTYLGNVSSPYDNDAVLSETGKTPEEVKAKLLTSINADKKLLADTNINKTKFSQYQLPGGENYREVLIKAPAFEDKPPSREASVEEKIKYLKTPPKEFLSSHWDEPNVLAHIRINDRTTPDGKKVLFIEEIQSDWAKEQRRLGNVGDFEKASKEAADYLQTLYKKYDSQGEMARTLDRLATLAEKTEYYRLNDLANKAGKGVPSHPFLKNWQELALKNIIKKAVDGSYDYISWTTGEQQAERYDLSKQIDYINYAKNPEGTYNISAFKNDSPALARKNIKETELEGFIGKDIAHKIIKGEGTPRSSTSPVKTLEGENLKIGGEWAVNLYNRQIPNILKDLTRGEAVSIVIKTKENEEYKNLKILEYALSKMGNAKSIDVKLASGTKLSYNKKDLKEDIEIYRKKAKVVEPTQPALAITPQIRMRVIGQPIGGGSSFEKRKEIMEKRLTEVSLAKEELQSLNAIRNQLRGRIQKYRGAYVKEELGGIPRYYITNQEGIKPDELIGEINSSNFGVQLQNENELKDWLIGLEKRRKELVTRIETNRPELEAHKESTLLAQEGKIRQQEIKKFTGQAKKAATEAAKITTRLQGKAFREGKATASEQRKVAYFGEQISKEERSKLYLMAKDKGLYYTDFLGRPHDILKGLLKFYQGASFDQLREYITNLTGDPENPPKLFKLYGDITKDTEVIKLLKQVTSKWQDINKVEMNTLDPVRIVEKVTRQDLWDNILADNTFNVYAAADEAMYDRLVQLLNELDANRQGVNKGSKESQEIMRKFEAGETLTEKEQKVVDYLRKKYDALIAEANEMRARLKKRPIPYRQDYMTHIREQNLLSDFFKGDLDAAKNISLGQLDAIRKGDYTKGNMPFNKFALRRTGPRTKYDAIGNYEIYLRTMLKEIYYTPAITHARKFIEYALIRQPNAYMALDRLANDLKGKTSLNDKWFGGVLLSTKPIKKMRSLIAKSALLANLNFWIMNSSNFVVSYDELGNYMNKGMIKFLGTKKWRQFAFKHSNMLKGRTIDPDIDPGSFKTLEAALGYVTNLLEYNNVGSTFVGAYFKAIDLGYNQAKSIKYADAIARRTQVGYKKYELNAWMRSNSGMFLSQFQTWTFNAMNHLIYDLKLGNVPGNLVSKFTGKGKKPDRWGAFFRLVVISMLLNYMYKKAGLREPYGPDSAVPRIPGIAGAVPPIFRVGQNIVSAFVSKKPETKQKAAIRAITSFIPAGTQLNRFFTGKVFPMQPEEKQTVKFPSKFKNKFPAKFKSKFK